MCKQLSECSQNMKNISNCSICFDKQARASINCTHKFCLTCISQWAKKKTSCPLCRKPFSSVKYGKRQFNYQISSVAPKVQPRVIVQPVILPWPCFIYWKPIFCYQQNFSFVQQIQNESIQ